MAKLNLTNFDHLISLLEIETALDKIETDLPEIETTLSEIETALLAIKIHTLTQFDCQQGCLDFGQGGTISGWSVSISIRSDIFCDIKCRKLVRLRFNISIPHCNIPINTNKWSHLSCPRPRASQGQSHA